MAFIQVIKNEQEYHLEMWNEPALIEAGIQYTIVSPVTDITLSNVDDVVNG